MPSDAQFGVVGLAVMGSNLALNLEEHGVRVAVFNRTYERTAEFLEEHRGKRLTAARTLQELASSLTRPRRMLLMVKAGKPTDDTLDQLLPFLETGDVVVDGGNAFFEDTRRRERRLAEHGVHFVGCGISGGEDGARNGPSLMPGGKKAAYAELQVVLESIAAHTDSGPCVTYVGPDGAGHFVKMVHNGIEYGDMQLIAEAYDVLHRMLGMRNDELAQTFERWNAGVLESFLIELSARIFRVKDEETGKHLVDLVLDQAEQKGTGKWTVQAALEQGVPIPTIAAAVDARMLSSRKSEREQMARVLHGPLPRQMSGELQDWIGCVEDALYASKICCYAQGLDLIRRASDAFQWNIDLSEMARIWTGGCIIRARLLSAIHRAFRQEPKLTSLMLEASFREAMTQAQSGWRKTVAEAIACGIPVPAMSASLAYFDSMRTPRLPQNLTQAQRDAFGAHTFVRTDATGRGPVHSSWNEATQLEPRRPSSAGS